MTRLTRRAQERATQLSSRLDNMVRSVASTRAQQDNREFADVHDVNMAYEIVIAEIMGDFRVHGSDGSSA